MKVEFDNAHLVAYGKEFINNCPSVAYNCNSNIFPLSQIQICITGDANFILNKLKKIIDEMEFEIKYGELNKPNEGILAINKGYFSEVIVPVWDNKVDESVDFDSLVDNRPEN